MTENGFSDLSTYRDMSCDDVIAAFAASGGLETLESYHVYPVAHPEDFLGTPLSLELWEFRQDARRDFVRVVVNVQGHRYVLTHTTAGIFQQLRRLTDYRIRTGHPTPTGDLDVPSGLTVSRHKRSGTEVETFYLSTD